MQGVTEFTENEVESSIASDPYVFSPDHTVLKIWFGLMFLFSVLSIAATPYCLAFYEENQTYMTIDIGISIAFAIDFLLAFNLGYYDRFETLI
jgi:hypothetical protein